MHHCVIIELNMPSYRIEEAKKNRRTSRPRESETADRKVKIQGRKSYGNVFPQLRRRMCRRAQWPPLRFPLERLECIEFLLRQHRLSTFLV